MTTADAVVVGGGVIGAALAHRLAAAGLGRVILCDQGRPAAQGATSRSGGLLRLHHTAHCDTLLAARSLPVYEHWAELVGGDCGYRRTGFLMLVGEERAAALRTNAAAVTAAAGAGRTEVIDPEQARALYPGIGTEGLAAAAYEPDGGYADPVATTAALLAAGRRAGVRVFEGIRVEEVLERGGTTTGVRTQTGTVEAPLVVLAGGAWGSGPAAGLGVRMPVTPRRIGLAQVELAGAGVRGAPESVPTCIDDTIGSYFRPEGRDRCYFGVPSNPDVRLGHDVAPLDSGEVQAALAAVGRRVPAAAGAPVVGARSGFDGYTPDKHPVVGPAGPAGPDGLYLALGFSGGGFKLAPAVAELAAVEIAEGGAVPGKHAQEPLEPYRPQRFDDGGSGIVREAPYEHM